MRDLGIFLLSNHVAIDLDVFDGAGDVALVGADPVSDDAGAEHVGDEFVALAVPDEEGGAGAAAAVDFEVVLLLVAGDLDFVLQHSGGPEHAHDVGFFGLAEADGEIRRVLAKVAVGAVDLEFLAIIWRLTGRRPTARPPRAA